MNYLSADEIVSIHDAIVKEIGGTLGVREPGMLMSIAEKPKASFGDQDLYPDLFTKAAALYDGVCNYHVFIDGNKRTSALCMYRFLHINGYDLVASNKDLEEYTLHIATNNPDLSDIATWIRKNSTKLK